MTIELSEYLLKFNPATQKEFKITKGIIYLIFNTCNGKVYVGQAGNTFLKRYAKSYRWWQHIENKHLYNAIIKYGYNKFEVSFIEINKTIEQLNELEVFYIAVFNSRNSEHGYNQTGGGRNYIHHGLRRQLKTTEQFIEESRIVHGDKYDYNKSVYVNRITKTNIFCKRCNTEFFQSPGHHLQGSGCRKCEVNYHVVTRLRLTKEEFIERSINRHGDVFDYTDFCYHDAWTKSQFICKKHKHIYTEDPANHLYSGKSGCRTCLKEQKWKKTARIDISTGNIIEIFSSFKDAVNYLKEKFNLINPRGNLYYACLDKNKIYYGFKWQFI